jgi:hypothetical protein
LHTTRKNHQQSRNCKSSFFSTFHILFRISAKAVPFVQSLSAGNPQLHNRVASLFRGSTI